MKFDIGFLGYGSMARAISAGLAGSGFIPYERQIISGRDHGKLEKAARDFGVKIAIDNKSLSEQTKTVVIGVKPSQVISVMQEIKDAASGSLLISLAAGVKLDDMRPALPPRAALVRSMPNVAVLIRKGTSLICATAETEPAQLETARKIFASVGICLELDEAKFDAAGAVSGSGPAYFFEFMEHMIKGAVRLGLGRAEARMLVASTALGAAEMAMSDETAALPSLRDMVTSPGGTTAEALHVFECGALGGLVQKALEAATQKSRKLI